MKFFKSNEFLLLVVLLFITFLSWRHIPTVQFQGEGFYYFLHGTVALNEFNFSHYDFLAKLLFTYLPGVFRDNVSYYMWLLFAFMLLTDGVFYLLVRVITKSKLAGLIAALLFSLSFIGKYDMYSSGNYHYFVQRGILLAPLLISFVFLHLYIVSSRLQYFLVSLFLYLMSIKLGFFGTWFLAPFVFYPTFYLIHKVIEKRFDAIKKVFWLPLPYIIGNLLIIKNSSYATTEVSILELILNKTSFVITGLVHQLFVMTVPINWYKFFSVSSLRCGLVFDEVVIFGGILVFLYGGGILLVKKYNPKWLVLSITALFSALSMLFFNLYLNIAATLSTVGSSRYFYYPYTMVALFWGLVIATILLKISSFKLKAAIIFMLALLLINNILLIKNEVNTDYRKHKNNYDTIVYLRNWSSQIKSSPSYLMLPSNFGAYGGEFAKKFFISPDTHLTVEGLHQLDFQELAKNKVNPERIFVLHYDHPTESVIDETIKWREYLRLIH